MNFVSSIDWIDLVLVSGIEKNQNMNEKQKTAKCMKCPKYHCNNMAWCHDIASIATEDREKSTS